MIICDRCYPSKISPFVELVILELGTERFHLCVKCKEEVRNFLKSKQVLPDDIQQAMPTRKKALRKEVEA